MQPCVLVILATESELEACRSVVEHCYARWASTGVSRFAVRMKEVLVVVEKLGAMGTLEAAAATTALIDRHHPKLVIAAGICGAINPTHSSDPRRLCDLIVASRVVYYEPEKLRPSAADWRPRLFAPSVPESVLALLVPRAEVMPRFVSPGSDVPKPRRHIGLYASGEQVVAATDVARTLVARCYDHYGEGPAAVEMEAAGIARACLASATPYLVAKAVSDFATEEKNDDWQRAAASVSIESVLRWVEGLTPAELDTASARRPASLPEDELRKACTLVEVAGHILPCRGVGTAEFYDQGTDDLVCSTDLAVGEFLREHFGLATAQFYIEDDDRSDADDLSVGRCWIIDPVDGTQNLVSGRPDVAVSAALYEEGRAALAVVGLPFRRMVVSATDHGGVEVNGYPVLTERERAQKLEDAVVGLPGDLRRLQNTPVKQIIDRIASRAAGIRISGALAVDLTSIALGELDARISTDAKIVDVAAGALLVRRANGVVTDLDGREWDLSSKSVVAARSHALHKSIMDLLTSDADPAPALT